MDVHEGTATVREAMRFSAYLRQPYEIPKEEKDALGRSEEFRLPDGNTVQVRARNALRFLALLTDNVRSWVLNGSVHLRFCLTRS